MKVQQRASYDPFMNSKTTDHQLPGLLFYSLQYFSAHCSSSNSQSHALVLFCTTSAVAWGCVKRLWSSSTNVKL